MTTRSAVLLSLLLLVCLVVLVASAFAQEQLTTLLGSFRFRDVSRLFRFVLPGEEAPFTLFRRPSLLVGLGRDLLSSIAAYAFLFFAGLLTLFGFPRQLRVLRNAYTEGVSSLLRMLGIGAFGALVLLLLMMLGLLTFAIFPLPLVLLVALLLAAWIGLVGLALAVGQFVNRWAGLTSASPILDLAFGVLILFTATRIPFLGVILLVLLTLWALGSVLLTRFGHGGVWTLAPFNQLEESQS